MSSKKKYIILIVLVLMFPFFLIRILNNVKIEEFKHNLEITSEDLKKDFLDQKSIILNETIKSKKVKDLFIRNYNEKSAFSQFDTVLNFLYITTPISFVAHDKKYLFCLLDKSNSEENNQLNEDKIKLKNKKLKKKYGKIYTKWYPKYKAYLQGNDTISCEKFFNYSLISFHDNNWEDFSNLLSYFTKKSKEQNIKNYNEKLKFKKYKSKKKRQLKSKFHNNFETKITNKQSVILEKQNETFVFNSTIFGDIVFDLELIKLNKSKFDNISEKIFIEQWENNTLYTGATPYKSCFGSNPKCYPPSSYRECSFIKVIAPFNSNVIVTVKKRGSVYKHAYIKPGSSYKFTLPNGTYQTFFYYGNGWNPNKKLKSSSCGYLKGAFVREEAISKSNFELLNHSSMTYTLELRSNGNFSPKSSTSNEAF